MNFKALFAIAIVSAAVAGCTDQPMGPTRVDPAQFDRVRVYVARSAPVVEDVELAFVREGGMSTVSLFRPDGIEQALLLDTIGPQPEDPDKVRQMLASFDLWTLTAPDAPGGACRTVSGERNCNLTHTNYTVVLMVEIDGVKRAQRYTGLDKSSANASVRALGDFVLAWARERESPPS
jgi:hypothetical protein